VDVASWLRRMGLERYETTFRDNAISEKILPRLTADDLRDLGVSIVGHRRLLLDAIADLRSPPDVQPRAPASPAATVPIRPGNAAVKRRFRRYIGIDYSGAQTPSASLTGLRFYIAAGDASPQEIPPPMSRRRYWSRRGVAERLVELLTEDTPTLIGIDHGFSFPLRYFEAHGLKLNWADFLDDFQLHWPTDEDHAYVDFVRDGALGDGAKRAGDARWRRLTEKRAGSAKSVFHFDVQGQVAKSTHAGIPWLRFVRQRVGTRVFFWPFDGWEIPEHQSAVAEVYPSLWRTRFRKEDRTDDQHDAFCIAAWLAHADRDGILDGFLKPELTAADRGVAQVEGWILGVP
jgi:SAM domain (Sterile alpha motif)